MFNLPDIVTYWVSTYDTDGKKVIAGVGIKANARVGSRAEEVVTEQGKEPLISKLAIYLDGAVDDVKTDFLITVGDFDGQVSDTKVTKARRVLARSEVSTGTTAIRLLV